MFGCNPQLYAEQQPDSNELQAYFELLEQEQQLGRKIVRSSGVAVFGKEKDSCRPSHRRICYH